MNNHINNINITYDLEGTKFSANRLVFNNYEIENIDSDSYTKVSDINSVIDNYRNNKGIDDPNSMYVLNDAQHNTNYIELKYNMYDVEFAANEIILDNHDIHQKKYIESGNNKSIYETSGSNGDKLPEKQIPLTLPESKDETEDLHRNDLPEEKASQFMRPDSINDKDTSNTNSDNVKYDQKTNVYFELLREIGQTQSGSSIMKEEDGVVYFDGTDNSYFGEIYLINNESGHVLRGNIGSGSSELDGFLYLITIYGGKCSDYDMTLDQSLHNHNEQDSIILKKSGSIEDPSTLYGHYTPIYDYYENDIIDMDLALIDPEYNGHIKDIL